MYLCGPGKHNCQPFCGPEGRFYCSDSVCSLWPAPFSYLCVSVRILGVCWKLSAAEQVKTDCCHTPAVVSTLLTPLPVSCHLTTPHHYIYYDNTERTMFRGKPPFQATKQRRGRRRKKKEKNIHTKKHTVKRWKMKYRQLIRFSLWCVNAQK